MKYPWFLNVYKNGRVNIIWTNVIRTSCGCRFRHPSSVMFLGLLRGAGVLCSHSPWTSDRVLLRHQHGDDLSIAPVVSGSDRSFETRSSRYTPGWATQSAVIIARWHNNPSWACDKEEEDYGEMRSKLSFIEDVFYGQFLIELLSYHVIEIF